MPVLSDNPICNQYDIVANQKEQNQPTANANRSITNIEQTNMKTTNQETKAHIKIITNHTTNACIDTITNKATNVNVSENTNKATNGIKVNMSETSNQTTDESINPTTNHSTNASINTTTNHSTNAATKTAIKIAGNNSATNVNQNAHDTTSTDKESSPKISFSEHDGDNDEVDDEPIADREKTIKKESFIRLNSQQQKEVSRALAPSQPSQVIVQAHKIIITKQDIRTLRNECWLNDEIINFYMNMLVERNNNNNNNEAPIHAFSTFFYPKLVKEGHRGVKGWSKKFNLFAFHRILIPVHLGNHWCLAVIDMKKKKITYYDSKGASNNKCLQALKQYMIAESQTKNINFNESEWTLLNKKDIPQQMNNFDCGVFACKFAEYITRDEQFSFSQDHMEYFRQRMVYEIMHNCLL